MSLKKGGSYFDTVTQEVYLTVNLINKGGQSQNRTADTRLFRPLLYRLS